MIIKSPSRMPRGPLGTPTVSVLASGSGTNFAAIADAARSGALDVRIAGVVYNNADAGVAARAAERGIAAQLIDHRDYPDRRAHDAAVVAQLRAWGTEWVAMAGWMRIVSNVVLDAFPERILNIHPSLLPAFRGLDAVGQAVRAGVQITGCTVHYVTDTLDDGPIVAQAAVCVEDDDVERLLERIHEAEHILYPHALALAIAATRT